jgi:tetrapyrrole methylase family protein / MazG family protein
VVRVVGLGPGRPGLVTAEALEALRGARCCWLRTARHPSASLAQGARSFDDLYESAVTLEEVYSNIVEALVGSATSLGECVYAVPGSPSVAERTVELLHGDGRVRVEVMAGVSFADLAFARLRIDPVAAGATLVDGQRFTLEAAGRGGPLLVGQCDSLQVLSEVKLGIAAVLEDRGDAGPEGVDAKVAVTVLQRLGLPDEAVFAVPWDELDRAVHPDHLTSLWVPELGAPFASEMVRLEQLGRTLRLRCPWDRQQTHDSLTRYLLEEAYETLEAIEELGPDGAGYEHLEEELGDVLFQVVFHSVLAAEQGQFALGDVARRVHAKLVGRHPHVFGGVSASTPEDVARNWEQIKRSERGDELSGLMDGLPRNLPALLYAYKLQGRAASVGFDWEQAGGALAKVGEELAELEEAVANGRDAFAADGGVHGLGSPEREELGDLLFAVVNVARKLKVDPEEPQASSGAGSRPSKT